MWEYTDNEDESERRPSWAERASVDETTRNAEARDTPDEIIVCTGALGGSGHPSVTTTVKTLLLPAFA